ncbi:MAG: DUF2141 domain-containing protein [Syntrophotaleaceae bacterium]
MRLFGLYVLVAWLLAFAAVAQAGELVDKVCAIEKTEGRLAIGLFSQAKGFPETNQAHKGVYLPVTAREVAHVFSDIPAGEYAVAIFHDSNSNNQLDKNFVGMPKEGYGFSNNASGFFGPPSFADASFHLNGNATVKVDLKY